MKNALALTFDDGPDPSITPEILTLLKKYSAKCTFFVIGENAKKYPEIIKRMHLEGHIIACHDLNHSWNSNFRFTNMFIKDISESQSIIKSIIGLKPLLYRPPIGLTNPHLGTALQRLGMYCIGWTKRPIDFGNRVFSRFDKLEKFTQGNNIVLLHDTLPNLKNKAIILNFIEEILKEIHTQKINLTTIDTYFKIPAYSK